MPYKDPVKRREQVARWRKANPEKKREHNRRSDTKHRRKYINAAPEKHRARWKIRRELAAGRLIRQVCEICGILETDAHHDDYAKPLDVRWLCRKHHLQHHMGLGSVTIRDNLN